MRVLDFYNPTNQTVAVVVRNLAYGNYIDVLQYYFGGGLSYEIVIPSKTHKLLLDSQGYSLMSSSFSEHPSILFDFIVSNGNVTVSSLAAKNKNNLQLRNETQNVVDATGAVLNDGAVIETDDERPNEKDINIKYKGIARNQSAWVDARLSYVVDDTTASGPLKVQMSDPKYPDGVYGPRDKWMTHTSPLQDQWDGILYAMPATLHEFKYHASDNREWHFDIWHQTNDNLNSQTGPNDSYNQPVSNEVIANVKADVAQGYKVHF